MEAVEPESGAFGSQKEAEAAKQRHLDAHAKTTDADDSRIAEIDPYLRYRG
jgi:hypothetical protein